MTGFRSFNNSTCKRVLNLLEADNLRLTEYVVKRITVIEFGVNDTYRDKIAVSTYDCEKPNHKT